MFKIIFPVERIPLFDFGSSRRHARIGIGRRDIGLSSSPTDREGYDDLVTAAQDLLREPMERAREYMKQAMDAEEAGLDGTEYVQMVDEVLRKPLEQVKEMVDSFDFGNAEEVLKMLKDYNLSCEQQAKYDTIYKMVRNVDRDAVLEWFTNSENQSE